MTDSEPTGAELDALLVALARLRGGGGRGPRGAGPHHSHHPRGPFGPGHGPGHGPFGGGPFGPGGPFGTGPHPFGPGGRGGAPARVRLLEALAVASHPLTVSEVGEAIGVDQPRASRLIQQAVDRGLVRREADPDDARRTRVALTEDGTRLAQRLHGRRREQLITALADFSAEERAELTRLLTKLAAAWPGPDDEA